MARKKLKKFTTLELMLSVLLLVVFIITIPIFVLSARDSLESQGNKEVWSYPSICCSFQSRNLINGREVMLSCSLVWAWLCSVCVCWGPPDSNCDSAVLFSSVQFSHSVVSDSLWPMDSSMPGLPVHHQLPEPAQTHVHWVGDTIQPSHPLSSPFLPTFNLSQHQGLFQSQLLAWGGQIIGVSASASVLPMNHPGLISFRMDWLDLLAVQGTLKGLFQLHSSKASILQHSPFFMVQLSYPYMTMTTGKTIALTRWTFVGKIM